MNAIIIDDERYSVKAIIENIHWDDLYKDGIKVQSAYNVEQAKK